MTGTNRAYTQLAGFYLLAAIALWRMYDAALDLARASRDGAIDTRPCPDCRDSAEKRKAVVDVDEPTPAPAGDPSSPKHWAKVRDNPQA